MIKFLWMRMKQARSRPDETGETDLLAHPALDTMDLRQLADLPFPRQATESLLKSCAEQLCQLANRPASAP